jgi:hypothetical protein
LHSTLAGDLSSTLEADMAELQLQTTVALNGRRDVDFLDWEPVEIAPIPPDHARSNLLAGCYSIPWVVGTVQA